MNPKLKILHSAALLTPSAGMLKQMNWEQKSANQLKLDWTTAMYCPSGSNQHTISKSDQNICVFDSEINHTPQTTKINKILNWYKLRKNYYNWLKMQSCDIYLLRYYVHDIWQYQFIKNSSKPVLLVHHSFEVPELLLPNNNQAKLRGFLEKQIGKYSLQSSSGIIGVTEEIIQHELNRLNTVERHDKNSFLYPNGYHVNNNQTLYDNRNPQQINLIFIASYFDSWHGLDLLLANIKKSNLDFKLHLVGKLSEHDYKVASTDNRVIMHGLLSKEEISALSYQCDVGLGSFALYRKNMQQACTLKVREYLSLGVPVYTGHQDIFPENFPYYKNSFPEIDKICGFAIEMREEKRTIIQEAALPYLDKSQLLNQLYQNLITTYTYK
ncbi:hypothetical protein ADP71_03310 [Vitreoscilla sp. C1]|uniref:glycosyltransferase family 1 protein n=1 Tax=Vitreoscilla sp. (strain C1) TaxID=96942 RepID=UPI00148E93DA|nr:glycosyltransferase family 1 protein [Vitreoscilla sp. C1]AUZ04142.2 hypothetical protein ADP71_03310 [Vitreoscilla sp. C1]